MNMEMPSLLITKNMFIFATPLWIFLRLYKVTYNFELFDQPLDRKLIYKSKFIPYHDINLSLFQRIISLHAFA